MEKNQYVRPERKRGWELLDFELKKIKADERAGKESLRSSPTLDDVMRSEMTHVREIADKIINFIRANYSKLLQDVLVLSPSELRKIKFKKNASLDFQANTMEILKFQMDEILVPDQKCVREESLEEGSFADRVDDGEITKLGYDIKLLD